jgi:hypothetical protein
MNTISKNEIQTHTPLEYTLTYNTLRHRMKVPTCIKNTDIIPHTACVLLTDSLVHY